MSKFVVSLQFMRKIKYYLNKLYTLRVISQYNYMLKNHYVLYWSRSIKTKKNFGDALNPILFQKATGKNCVHEKDILNYRSSDIYYFIGSILDQLYLENMIVCGAGFKRKNTKIKKAPKTILAVRGPLSRDVFLENNIFCPEVYCDPGLLVSDFFKFDIEKKYDIGIIPHYIDKNKMKQLNIEERNKKYKIIDIESDIEKVLIDINSCRFIASSSLHGIIAAHTYNIPAVWIELSNKVAGEGFKFRDYLESVNIKTFTPVNLVSSNNVYLDDLISQCTLPEESIISYRKKLFYQEIKKFFNS